MLNILNIKIWFRFKKYITYGDVIPVQKLEYCQSGYSPVSCPADDPVNRPVADPVVGQPVQDVGNPSPASLDVELPCLYPVRGKNR